MKREDQDRIEAIGFRAGETAAGWVGWDNDLIAIARDDVPWLIERLQEQAKAVAVLTAACEKVMGRIGPRGADGNQHPTYFDLQEAINVARHGEEECRRIGLVPKSYRPA